MIDNGKHISDLILLDEDPFFLYFFVGLFQNRLVYLKHRHVNLNVTIWPRIFLLYKSLSEANIYKYNIERELFNRLDDLKTEQWTNITKQH